MKHGVSNEEIIKVNLYGSKLATEAFLPMVDPKVGRIVNVGSGAGPMYVKGVKDKDSLDLLSSCSHKTTWE